MLNNVCFEKGRFTLAYLKINSLENLSKNELEILTYINENIQNMETMSIHTLSQNTHYSTSTILRLCKKIGFSGYSELKYFIKRQIENSIVKPSETIPETNSFETIKNNILIDFEGSAGLLNTDDLFQIVKLLASNQPIYLYHPGGITNITVDYLESLLFLTGCKNVYKTTSSKMASHVIQKSKKPCILLIISNSGNFQSTLDLALEAKSTGVTVISISSIENNDLAQISDYNLRFLTKIRKNGDADLTSRACTFFVIQILIEHLKKYIKGMEKTGTHKSPNNPM